MGMRKCVFMRGSAVIVSKGPPAGEPAWEPVDFHSLLTLHSCLVSSLPGGPQAGWSPTDSHPPRGAFSEICCWVERGRCCRLIKNNELRKSSGFCLVACTPCFPAAAEEGLPSCITSPCAPLLPILSGLLPHIHHGASYGPSCPCCGCCHEPPPDLIKSKPHCCLIPHSHQ